jgi:dimethylamine monooxygenase subunit A
MGATEGADRPDGAVPYVPVENRPWRLAMGLRPLAVPRWLEVDGRRAEELALKRRLLDTDHARVVAALPGSEEPGRELLDEIVGHLGRHHPGLIQVGPDGAVTDCASGTVVEPGGLHPVDAAGRLVQEDLCVMTNDGGGWVLTAARVCFPSRWRLEDKIGRDLGAIHRPVPGYEAALGRPTRSFFDRLRPQRPVWRLNWTLLDSPQLFLPAPGDRILAPADLTQPDRALWFRVERQTLRRLSERPSITFTIRTYVASLGELVAAHPEVVPVLRSTLPSVPGDTLAYKRWANLIGPLLTWLATVA